MPIYEYKCNHCGVFEVTQRITEKSLKKCPTCRGKVERIISATSFVLKGNGWYATDYAAKSKPDSTAGDSAAAGNGATATASGSSSNGSTSSEGTGKESATKSAKSADSSTSASSKSESSHSTSHKSAAKAAD
ncbi:MAG: FmdB family zinc ribbon protein [Candidatus Binataceae bacterium]